MREGIERLKGTRDFLPQEKILRDKTTETIRQVFELYAFNPLETPCLELFTVLSSKYAGGSEILKETYRFKDQGGRDIGLRYDLTVPLSRVLAMNPNLAMPFKRYQIGRVFRDGPTKTGRYREFMQCDVDTIGVKDMIADAEIIALTSRAFKELGMIVEIKVNNRKVLEAIIRMIGPEAGVEQVMITLDKIDKIGEEGVKRELKEKGVSPAKTASLMKEAKGKQKDLDRLEKKLDKKGKEGVSELKALFCYLDYMKAENVVLDLSLARGLAYYTGTVFEAYTKGFKSAIAAGGRYDKIIGSFLGSGKECPAVGISFGVDPICELLKKEKKQGKKNVSSVYIIPIKTLGQCIKLAEKLRNNGIKTDIDLLDRGPSKNLAHASKQGTPFTVIVGEEELKKKKVKLKDMETGKEKLLTEKELIDFMTKKTK